MENPDSVARLELTRDPEPGFLSRMFGFYLNKDSWAATSSSSENEPDISTGSIFNEGSESSSGSGLISELPQLTLSSLEDLHHLTEHLGNHTDMDVDISSAEYKELHCYLGYFGQTKDGSLDLRLDPTQQNFISSITSALPSTSSAPSSTYIISPTAGSDARLRADSLISALTTPFYQNQNPGDEPNFLSRSAVTTTSSLHQYPLSGDSSSSSSSGGIGSGIAGGGGGDFDSGSSSSASSIIITAVKRLFQTDNNRTVSGYEAGILGNGFISSSNVNISGGGSTVSMSGVGSTVFCNRTWDGAICWPEIPEGHSVTVPCMAMFREIAYDTSNTVTRACEEGGVWEEKTNYSNCAPLRAPSEVDSGTLDITTYVYFGGYSFSLTALLIAISIFIVFKELRCLRNTIHTHLMVTYIAADALWLVTSIQSKDFSHSLTSCGTFILLHYFHLTNFAWMLVEGLYLYVLVVQTFTADNIKLRIYTFIGWGIPLLVIISWSIAKWITRTVTPAGTSTSDTQSMDPDEGNPTCFWLTVKASVYDWIYEAPFFLVLAANTIFLLQIMWVLITKLRSATNPETQQSRKAAKALVVLMPLLGITYVLILTGSKEPMYEHTRALLISTQGFLVALLYCFLNGEVRQAVRHRWNRVKGRTAFRILCCDCNRRRQMSYNTRDWSMNRSRTESIRLYNSVPPNNVHSTCQKGQPYQFPRNRMESTTSEMTNITNMTNSNSIQQLGGRLSSIGSGINRSRGSSEKNGNGRNNSFDQVLLSPTFTSISTNLSALAVSADIPETPGEFTDVHFIDDFDGEQDDRIGLRQTDSENPYD